MFTVILTSERSQQLIEPWRELFAPFEARGDVAFCTWNTGSDAVSLEQAVPELPQAVKGRSDWRAIVLLGLGEEAPGDDAVGQRNPFDYVPFADVDADTVWDHSPWALIRLTHMLLGLPELGPKGFEADPSFTDPDSRRTIYRSMVLEEHEAVGSPEGYEEFTRRALVGNNPRIHYRVIPASDEETESHSRLAEHYGPHQSMPNEVLLVSPQIRRRQKPVGLLQEAWSSTGHQRASRFVERNRYPASCRFLTYEMSPTHHVQADLQAMNLVIALLALATNDLPASGLQAERLYRLNVELDTSGLADSLNRHMWQLIDVRQRIDARLEQEQRPTTSAAGEILADTSITVDLGSIDGDDLNVPVTGYGLAADSPTDGMLLWREGARRLSAAAEQFVRQPPRALQRAVADTRSKMATDAIEGFPLSELDVEELEVELTRRSDSLVQQADSDIVDGTRLFALIEDYDRIISRAQHQRMRAGTIRMATFVALGAWSLALGPYVLASLFDGATNAAESLLVSGVLLLIVSTAALVTLVVMRGRFLSHLRALNTDLRAMVSQVNEGARRYAGYLAGVATYARGRRLLLAEQQRIAALTEAQRRLRLLRTRLDDRIEAEKSIVRSVGRPIQIEGPVGGRAETQAFEPEDALQALLWTPGRTPCKFNASGDTIVAPYPFVTRLVVEDLGVQELESPRGSRGYDMPDNSMGDVEGTPPRDKVT